MGYINKRGKPELVMDPALLRGGTSFRSISVEADQTPASPQNRQNTDQDKQGRRTDQ